MKYTGVQYTQIKCTPPVQMSVHTNTHTHTQVLPFNIGKYIKSNEKWIYRLKIMPRLRNIYRQRVVVSYRTWEKRRDLQAQTRLQNRPRIKTTDAIYKKEKRVKNFEIQSKSSITETHKLCWGVYGKKSWLRSRRVGHRKQSKVSLCSNTRAYNERQCYAKESSPN